MTHLDLRTRQALQARLMRRRLFGGPSKCDTRSCDGAGIVSEAELLILSCSLQEVDEWEG
jgi:hypothetical protein